MILSLLSFFSFFILFFLSIWCVFSSQYEDGVIGKFVFIVLGLSSYSAITGYPLQPNRLNMTIIISCIGVAVARHIIFKSFKSKTKEPLV